MRKTKLFMAIFAMLLVGAIFAQPLAASEPSVIRVSGAASVTMMPDVGSATFSAVVTEYERDAAITENNDLMTEILRVLRQRGIADDDLRTSGFAIRTITETIWDECGNVAERIHIGYRVTNNVTATFHDLDEVGSIIGAALAAGADLTGGPTFRVTDTTAGYYEAIALASRSARNRAQAIADALDTRIVGVLSVDETGTNLPVAQGGDFDGAPGPLAPAGAPTPAQETNWEIPIEISSVTITARVNIVFEIAP